MGRERLREAIHRWSARAERPFIRLNCAALPEALIESELFGHEKGAFTGAAGAREGHIEAADGGTLFLDEIGELPLATQAKLLRVLEAREIVRLGSVTPKAVDVRLVCATHRDLEAGVSAGTFRGDLFYRVNGISVEVPPLRDRLGEVEGLALMFAKRACEDAGRPPMTIAPETLAALRVHRWPGNVRELRNVIERAVALSTGPRIEPVHLLGQSTRVSAAPASAPRTLGGELSDLERARILDALERSGGNRAKAALDLGMPRRTLNRRLSAYGLTRPRGR